MMEDETVPLNDYGYRNNNKKVALWWALNISLLLFAFLAFVFAALNYSSSLQTTNINNNYDTQGGLINGRYNVSSSVNTIEQGLVLSFCGDLNHVCPGLGPRWSPTPLYPSGSLTPAIHSSLHQLSPTIAIYAWVASASNNIIRVVGVQGSGGSPNYLTYPTTSTLADPVTWLASHAVDNATFALAYTTHNTSYLQVGVVNTTITLGDPLQLFSVPSTIGGYIVNLAVAGPWIIVTYGENYGNANYIAFTFNPTSPNWLAPVNLQKGFGFALVNHLTSVYLGNNYFFQASGDRAVFGTIDIESRALNNLQLFYYGTVLYEEVHATALSNNYIALAGVQIAGVDVPITVGLVLQWNTQKVPYITAFYPNNLLETQGHQLHNFELSSCYIPPTAAEPDGELFYTYVDSITNRAKLIRAKITTMFESQVQLLTSPPIDISTFNYFQFGPSSAPRIACPSQSGSVLVAYQYMGTYLNTFMWEGGYRFAGIAQENYISSQPGDGTVMVLRQGIAETSESLQSGFSYYLTNGGRLRPYTSLVELFTPNAFRGRIGVAISPSRLLLDRDVFEYLTNGL